MRILILIITALSLFNCTEEKPLLKPPIERHFINYSRMNLSKLKADTVAYQDTIESKNDYYSIMGSDTLMIQGNNCFITKYHGARFNTEAFRVDNLGTVYVRSLDSSKYSVLHTNNDSFNNIVSTLIAYFLSDPKYYQQIPEVVDPESRIKPLKWDLQLYDSLHKEK